MNKIIRILISSFVLIAFLLKISNYNDEEGVQKKLLKINKLQNLHFNEYKKSQFNQITRNQKKWGISFVEYDMESNKISGSIIKSETETIFSFGKDLDLKDPE